MKIKLEDLKVKSFITDSIEQPNTVKGGSGFICGYSAHCPTAYCCPSQNCATNNCGSGGGGAH